VDFNAECAIERIFVWIGWQKTMIETWKPRTARVEHFCMTTGFSRGCGKVILKGERYAQTTYRIGLDHLELCMVCAEAQGAFSETKPR
jgi:hypothetical protein